MIPDLLIVMGGSVLAGLSGLVYEFARRGGTLRRTGSWTDRPDCGWRTPADWPAGRTFTDAEIDAAFAEITRREKDGSR